MNKLILQCLLAFVSLIPLNGQPVQSLWHAHHPGYRLPGTVPAQRLIIQLPSYGMGVYNSGFSFNDLVQTSTNNIYQLDVPAVLAKLQSQNTLSLSGGLHTLGLGFRLKNLWLEAGHQIRFENTLVYPRDLFGLFFLGNAPYIGQTANLALQVNSFNYSEFYLGAATEIGKYISLGIRAKFLNGAVGAVTDRSRLDFYTSDDVYQITVNSDFLLHTSPELALLKGEDTNLNIGLENYDWAKMISSNKGFAMDIGASVKFSDKLRLDAAIMDLGKIQWNKNVISYASASTIQYEGFEFSSLFSDDSLALVDALDSLETLLEFTEQRGGRFTTRLPAFFQAGLQYQITDRFRVSGMYFGRYQSSTNLSGISLGGTLALAKILEGGITWTIIDRTFDNIGLHAKLKLGPINIFAATDNIISLFRQDDNRYVNGRAGLFLGL